MSDSLRGFLRKATYEKHQQLDRLATVFSIDTRAGYARFLAAQAAALIPLEMALENSGVHDVLPDWPVRSRRAALLRDLTILAAPYATAPVPVPASAAEIFGVLYVLEGSRLGARVILRELDPSIHALGATQYLRHGEDAGLWQSFLTALENTPAARSDVAAVEAAANSAFAVFQRAFEQGAKAGA